MTDIFISYRREDARGTVDRLKEKLHKKFGAKRVFVDVESILAGDSFKDIIDQHIERCAIVLVIIGKAWRALNSDKLTTDGEMPDDYVLYEIESAIRQGKTIIPVLVENAAMPSAQSLPQSIRQLSERNAISIRFDPDFKADVRKLVTVIDHKLYMPGKRKRFYRILFAALFLITASIFFIERSSNDRPGPSATIEYEEKERTGKLSMTPDTGVPPTTKSANDPSPKSPEISPPAETPVPVLIGSRLNAAEKPAQEKEPAAIAAEKTDATVTTSTNEVTPPPNPKLNKVTTLTADYPYKFIDDKVTLILDRVYSGRGAKSAAKIILLVPNQDRLPKNAVRPGQSFDFLYLGTRYRVLVIETSFDHQTAKVSVEEM